MDGARPRRAEDMIPSASARVHGDDDNNNSADRSHRENALPSRDWRIEDSLDATVILYPKLIVTIINA